jgi:N-succinyldiaminopimelate aminotransferase
MAAWQDEAHVVDNRNQYRQTINDVYQVLNPVLSVEIPAGGFFLWSETPVDDTEFTRKLFIEQNITVLPGQYLSRCFEGVGPGINRVRMALVRPRLQCLAAAHSIRDFINNF